MLETSDYNSEYFFEKESEWNEYCDILDSYDEPTPQEKDMSYNIFVLEQAKSAIDEIANALNGVSGVLAISAEKTTQALQNFMDIYTEYESEIE